MGHKEHALSLPVHTLLAEAQHLPRHELDEPISGLLARRDADAAPESVAAAWDAEIKRRLEEIDRGGVEALIQPTRRIKLTPDGKLASSTATS